MARSLTVTMDAAVVEGHVRPVFLIELYFPSGTVFFCNDVCPVTWDGNTYLGAGRVSGLEPIQESIAPTASALNLRFSGIDSAHLTAILDDHYQGETARIYLALLDDDRVVLSDPLLVGEYRMDEPVVTVGSTCQVQLSLENRMADWDRPRLRRYNHADQTARYSGDLAFEYVEELQDKVIVWGIYKGPVAPDPLKVFNRTLDRALSSPLGKVLLAPFGITKPTLNAARSLGDRIANVFGW